MDETNLTAIDTANSARKEHSRIFEEYRDALYGAGPKLKELILDRAANDRAICLFELRELVRAAYPDGT